MDENSRFLFEGTKSASSFSRRIALIAFSASAFIFINMWIAYHNWDDHIRTRDNIAEKLLEIHYDSIGLFRDSNEFIRILNVIKSDTLTFKDEAWFWAYNFQSLLKARGRFYEEISPIASALLLLAHHRHLLEPEKLRQFVENNRTGDPGSHIHAPLLGEIHINDMTFLSGVTLSCLLLVLWFFLFSEKDNLKLFIASLSGSNKKKGYEALTVHQVLTVPLSVEENSYHRKTFFSIIAKFLYLIPASVQIYLLVKDYETFKEGYKASIELTDTSLLLGTLFTILVFILSIATLLASRMVDKDWKEFRRSIISPENPESTKIPEDTVETPKIVLQDSTPPTTDSLTT